MSQPSSRGRHAGIWLAIAILLAASIVGPLWVSSYARTTPALGGFPFFYWYQLMWVPIVAILSWTAYVLSKRAGGGGPGRNSSQKPGSGTRR